MTSSSLVEDLDVLVVGAGFAGLYQLERLRKCGQKVHVFESAGGLGGVWYWNCYPGARVDTWGPIYQFSDEQLWRDWNYGELYPEWSEVRAYFKYVDDKLNLSRDISFNTHVKAARFDEGLRRWRVEALDNSTNVTKEVLARFVVLCTGFGSKPYTPEIPGLDTFEGEAYHTARWPQDGVSVTGKRVGVIGTGASGVQVIQECGRAAGQLTVFQRTPILALPMRQRQISAEENAKDKETYPERMGLRYKTFAGFDFDFLDHGVFDVSPEERQATYERLWKVGGFVPWVGNFNDIFSNPEGNRTFYDFWRDKTRERIVDPDLWEVLAPTEPPHPFGVKRPSLEQGYFEVFNQDNVDVVDLRCNPIKRISPKGAVTEDGIEHELDLLVFATGFDAVTGGITAIDIRNGQGESIANSFQDGAHTALGSAVAGFPNMLFIYGPQSPSGFCNGPTCAEAHGEWVVELIDYMQKNNITRIEATCEAEQRWSTDVDQHAATTLFPQAKSWYMGANIPGKKVQMLMYPSGLPAFLGELNRSAAQGYPEFVTG